MSTNTIEWHKECLRNMKIYLKQKREELEILILSESALINEIDKLSKQIERAEKEGKICFDAEKYNKKRYIL